MTGGVPITRPRHCWTVLHVSILAALLLNLNADSEDSNCEVELRVQRGTAYRALRGGDLRIHCTVHFCNGSPPTVSWYKLEEALLSPVNSSRIKTEWERLNDSQGISHLIFQNILSSDSGVYRCKGGGSVSHNINVSVDVGDDEQTNVTQKNDTTGDSLDSETIGSTWMYVYPAAGIVAFVTIVIVVSVASMQGCKGKSKKETQTENQYVVIPMAEEPLPHASLQSVPRGSPSAPPSRRSTRRERPPSQPNESPSLRDSEHLYGKVKGDRERKRNTGEEEGGSIVYAALNHQPAAGAAARPWRPQEERSEYAAIRVKNPPPSRH